MKKGEILKDIEYVLSSFSFVTHISVYMLEDYYKKIENKNISYPENWKNLGIKSRDYQKEYLGINNYLKFVVFKRYEISNFAKSTFECKHNKAYWNHREVVGFGLGSHSFLDGKRYAYKDDFLSYFNSELEFKEILTRENRKLEEIIFGFRTIGLEENLQKELDKEKVKEFLDLGYLEFKDKKLFIKDDFIVLIDKIILELVK